MAGPTGDRHHAGRDADVILVAGGTGFIGAAVVRRLVKDGDEVAVMTAHPKKSAARIERLGARMIAGDVRDADSLDRAVSGAEGVVQALSFPNYPMEKPRKGFTFWEFEAKGTERLATAAVKGGVGTFVFASGVGATPDAPKRWFRAKWAGEQAIRASGLSHLILRPAWAYGPEDNGLNRFVQFHRWLPFVPVVGDGHQRLQPVFIDDVAQVLARAVKPDGPRGTFELGGPDVMTMNDVIRTMMDVRGKRKPMIHFPPWMPKLAGFFAQVLPRPPLTPDAVDFLTEDAVADVDPLVRAFGIELTPLREGLATYLTR
jgi:NADH dehydrogenase